MQSPTAITIRPLQESDASDMARLINNRKILDCLMDYIPNPYALKDAYHFIASVADEKPTVTFGIHYRKQFCGVIGLVLKSDVYRQSAELGYWVGEPYWGKGIATKAIQLATAYGFKELNLMRISANVFDFNVASMRVLEKTDLQEKVFLKKAPSRTIMCSICTSLVSLLNFF